MLEDLLNLRGSEALEGVIEGLEGGFGEPVLMPQPAQLHLSCRFHSFLSRFLDHPRRQRDGGGGDGGDQPLALLVGLDQTVRKNRMTQM